MYAYEWDLETGGLLLLPKPEPFSKEPRPVYYQELDLLGFDKYWNYEKDDTYPLLWAEANTYIYHGKKVAQTRGGSQYNSPEIILDDNYSVSEKQLQFVDIPAMVEKNRSLLDSLVQDTVKRAYNAYSQYRNKVDIFHVSYSGGKDSEVTLDIIQKAIPHNEFVVIFGDTGMEFPDTYLCVDNTEKRCEQLGIAFYRSKSKYSPSTTWNIFGPPSTTIRWCCSVHKTAPQLLKLREITEKNNFREMAFVGIRADESVKRSEYEYISLGEKHKGQYSCNPILNWNSAEVFLYIYAENLQLNDTYKKGNPRAGCLVCPMSRDKSDFMRHINYPQETEAYLSVVKRMSTKELETEEDNKRYIETGGWKLRTNGRDIKSIPNKYYEKDFSDHFEIHLSNPTTDWKTWMKTIGLLTPHSDNSFLVEKNNALLEFTVINTENEIVVYCKKPFDYKSIQYVKLFKQVFRKSAYCILCQECEADCQKGCISMSEGKLVISDDCIHCSNCHKPADGCLLYKSLSLPKGTGKMNNLSIDSYADHAPKIEWIVSFFDLGDRFFVEHTLGSEMINKFKRFLRDANLIENNATTAFKHKLDTIGIDNSAFWGLMLVNLCYSPEIKWLIKNTEANNVYSRTQLIEKLQNDGVKERGAKSITGAYKRIMNLPFGEKAGLGYVNDFEKTTYYHREKWNNPEPRVILYSLYKFAEACDGYYQFSLTRLLDHEIESEGISPTQIFGLNREEMEILIKGLSVNYPDFISSSFNLGLDTINLNREKTSVDVLELF